MRNLGLNVINLGMLLGGGFTYKISQLQVGIRSDYNINFNKICNKDNVTITDNTFTVQMTIGYSLHK